ncbi:helix-turn-helix transcriptional regulator [Georgenia sp. AZ-5]|uniref:helix-turn-helix transcriptional regulator n=1 Tax=Georgenia sp. AZ-5 TaxID=3367526 RepID=UPI003754AA4A
MSDHQQHPPDLSTKQVAAELGVSPTTISQYFASGKIPGAYRLSERRWRITRADLDAWKESQRVTPVVDPHRLMARTPRSQAYWENRRRRGR